MLDLDPFPLHRRNLMNTLLSNSRSTLFLMLFEFFGALRQSRQFILSALPLAVDRLDVGGEEAWLRLEQLTRKLRSKSLLILSIDRL